MDVKCDKCNEVFNSEIKELTLDDYDLRLYIQCDSCHSVYPMGWESDNTRRYNNVADEASNRLRQGTMTYQAHSVKWADLKGKMKKEFKRLDEKYKNDKRLADLFS